MSNKTTISLRTPLYFPEGNGSVRLDILVHKFQELETYTMTFYVYKKGVLLQQYGNADVFKVLKRLVMWVRDFGTKPEKTKDAKA